MLLFNVYMILFRMILFWTYATAKKNEHDTYILKTKTKT